jgi:hypothetical protein
MMNAKFQWFGFSIARKHLYFYLLLIAASVCANTMKDSILGTAGFSKETQEQLEQWREHLDEGQDVLASLP